MIYEVDVTSQVTRWIYNGNFHRECGPAIEHADGTKEWHNHGRYHRTDGPAIENIDGSKAWYIDGKLHRLDGPAIEGVDGYKSWYIDGEYLTEQQFNDRIKPVVEMTMEQICALVGKQVKVIK